MWIQDSKRRIFFDMHFPDWVDRQTSTAFNPKEIADTFAKSNVDSVIFYAKCQYGNFYYDTDIGHKHEGLADLNLFKEVFDLLKKENIKVIAYYSVNWDELLAEEHPEWLVEGSDGVRGSGGEFRWTTLCINSPYRAVVKKHIEEITKVLSPDGYWLDMTIIGENRCFCPYCKEKFKSKTGMSLEGDVTKNPKLQNAFIQFRYNYIEEFLDEIYKDIRDIMPDCMVSNNYWGYPYSTSSMGYRAVGGAKNADYLTGEAYTDWTGLTAPAFFSRWLRSVADGRPFEALIGRFTGTWDYTTKPPVQLALEAYTIVSNGGTVTIDDEPFADGTIDIPLYKNIQKIFEEIKSRKDYLDGEHIKCGAIFHSQLTKDYFFNKDEKFISCISGAYRLLKELGSFPEFLYDEDISKEKIAKYPFVVLSTVAVMSAEHRDLFQEYISNGGLVIAAGETAVYDVKDYSLDKVDGLSQLSGLKYEGLGDYTLTYYQLLENQYSKDIEKRPVTIRDRYVKYSGAKQEDVMGYLVDPICETTDKIFFHNNLPAPYKKTDFPSLIVKKIGKGTLVLFAQDVFAQFSRYHQLEIKQLFINILKAHEKLPKIQFSCTKNVEVSAQLKENNLILNLVNMCPGMSVCAGVLDTFTAKYPRTFEFIEKTENVHDIEINIQGYNIGKATSIATGKALKVEKKGDSLFCITLDILSEWETILIELK